MKAISVVIGFLLFFATLARGGHDLWAATVVYIALLCLVPALLFASSWKQGAKGLLLDFAIPLLALAGAIGLSAAQATNPGDATLSFFDWIAGITLFLLAVNVYQDEFGLRVLTILSVPLLWAQLAMSFVQYWTMVIVPEKYGTLVNGNIMAGFILLWMPVLARKLIDTWRTEKRIHWYVASGLVAGLVSFGMARTASGWLCLGVGSLFLFGPEDTLAFGRRHKKLVWSVVGILVVVGAALMGLKIHERYVEVPGALPREPLARLQWWTAAFKMFLDHPWLGIGPGNFSSAFLTYKVGTEQNTLFSHSSLLGILAETGLVGFLAFSSILLFWLRRMRADHRGLVSRWPYVVGVGQFFIFSLINVSFEYLIIVLLFCLFLGIIAAPVACATFHLRRAAIIVISGLCLLAIPWAGVPLVASQNLVAARRELSNNQIEAAIGRARLAAGLDPRAWGAYQAGAMAHYARYLQQNQFSDLEAAVRLQKEALRRNRLSAVLWWELSGYLKVAGDYSAALEAMERAHVHHRGNPAIQKDLEKLREETAGRGFQG